MTKHLAMYLRISQEKKGEGVETLTNHRNILTEYASMNNYTYEEFSEVLSGGAADLERRPELQRLLENIERFDGILVFEISRLSRNGLISETVLQRCADCDKPIYTPEKMYDLRNENDVLTFRFGSLIASQEHALIGKRSKNNKIAMAKQGLHIAGSVPYGYRRNDATRRLEVYEEEARAVRLIFQLHREGLGSRKIVDCLNREGYKPARSEAFQLPTVKRIVRNPAYKGDLVFQDRKRVKENGKYTYKIVNTIIFENAHEPIVSAQEWEAGNRERAGRADKARQYREKPAKKTGTTMLKDLIYCAKCGRKMSIRKEQNGVYSLKPCEFQLPNSPDKCGNSGIKLQFLEEVVVEHIKQYRGQLELELRQLEENDFTAGRVDLHDRINRIEAQILENQRQQAKLIELALADLFSHDEIRAKKQALVDEQQSLEAAKRDLLRQSETIDVRSHVQRIEHIIGLMDSFEELDAGLQNVTLKRFIKQFHYLRDMPDEIKSLSTRNPLRRSFPLEIEITYF